MLGDALMRSLKSERKDMEIERASGIFTDYNQPGLGGRRLANFAWMHFLAPFRILFFRPDFVLVRTTPPLIQLSYLFWCKIFAKKCAVWLMDYHPLVGYRKAGNAFSRFAWGALSRLDAFLMRWAHCFIVLDSAMESLVKDRCGRARVLNFPTWSRTDTPFFDFYSNGGDGVTLVYSGVLSSAHSFVLLKPFLEKLAKKKAVKFHYFGNSPETAEKFSGLCASIGVDFKQHGRIESFRDMGGEFLKISADYGVVLLNDSQAGIVSPSKYSGYITFGLPVLYLGPKGTNAWRVCAEFGAGITACGFPQLDECVRLVSDKDNQRLCASHARAAAEYFSAKQADMLAKAVLDISEEPSGK